MRWCWCVGWREGIFVVVLQDETLIYRDAFEFYFPLAVFEVSGSRVRDWWDAIFWRFVGWGCVVLVAVPFCYLWGKIERSTENCGVDEVLEDGCARSRKGEEDV